MTGSPQVEYEPDFKEIDLSGESPHDLAKCEDPRDTLASRMLTARGFCRHRRRGAKA